MFRVGQKAPVGLGPLTRVAKQQCRYNTNRSQILANKSSRAVRAPPKAARSVSGAQENWLARRPGAYGTGLYDVAPLPMNSRRQAGGVVEDSRIVSGFTGQ
jgi:hypothetical protein